MQNPLIQAVLHAITMWWFPRLLQWIQACVLFLSNHVSTNAHRWIVKNSMTDYKSQIGLR